VEFIWAIENISSTDIIDILIVAMMFFGLSFLFRGTQAMVLVRGTLVLLIGLVAISSVLQFRALGWVLGNVLTVLAVAIPIIFQPELRRGLEQLGRGSMLINRQAPDNVRLKIIEEICQAADKLSERRHGALIVLQRNSPLQDFIRTGIPLNSDVNSQLLLTLFWPKTELHDGAVIIDEHGRLAAAAAVLPLTANRNLPNRKMGTRHRAALGISEVSDAVCVVVSEETGKIAITNGGRMVARLDSDRLRTILTAFYAPQNQDTRTLWTRLRDKLRQTFKQLQERPRQT
jgi:diadenylate cyclase